MAGLILYCDSKTFLKKFIYDEIMDDFHFISVSDCIKVENNNTRNVTRMKSLMPPTEACNKCSAGNANGYYEEYMKHLTSPDIFPSILSIVNAYIKNLKIVFVCADDEDKDYGYFQIIQMYLKDVFGIKSYYYNYYRKNKEECLKLPENMDEVIKTYYEGVEWSKTHKSERKIKQERALVKEQLEEELKEMSSKELRKMCKENDVYYEKDMSKKELRKALIKKALKKLNLK